MKTILEKYFTGKGLMNFSRLLSLQFVLIMLPGCFGTVYVPANNEPRREAVRPAWAPDYDYADQVTYYYLPDLEVYYDVRRQEYVYYDAGAWIYSPYPPPMYSTYDMNNAYVVVLDYRVREPWRQHQGYVSTYPRYYYRTAYRDNTQNVRGYNENARGPIYHSNASDKRRVIQETPSGDKPRRDVRGDNINERRAVEPSNRSVDAEPPTHREVSSEPVNRSGSAESPSRREVTSSPANNSGNAESTRRETNTIPANNQGNSESNPRRSTVNEPATIPPIQENRRQPVEDKSNSKVNSAPVQKAEPTRREQPVVNNEKNVSKPAQTQKPVKPTNNKSQDKKPDPKDKKINDDRR